MFVLSARKLGKCCAGAVLGLDRENPHFRTLSGVERQSGPSSELPEWCSQASGALIQDLWGCTASKQPEQIHSAAPFQKEQGCLGKWLIPGGNSSAWRGHGEGKDLGVFLVELWVQECFPSCAAAWLSAPSPAWTQCSFEAQTSLFQAGKEGPG